MVSVQIYDHVEALEYAQAHWLAGGQLRELIKRLWSMQVGILLGTGLGVLWLSIDSGGWTVRALGAALLLYALVGLFLPLPEQPQSGTEELEHED